MYAYIRRERTYGQINANILISYNPLVFSLNFISNFLAIINVMITNFMKKIFSKFLMMPLG